MAKEKLIALYNDANENIRFFKNRMLTVLVSWSAVCAFLSGNNEKDDYFQQFDEFLFLIILVLGYLFSLFIYWEIYSALEKHRDRVRLLVNEFKKDTTFRNCYGSKGPGYGSGDEFMLYGGVAYMFLMFIFIMDSLELWKTLSILTG